MEFQGWGAAVAWPPRTERNGSLGATSPRPRRTFRRRCVSQEGVSGTIAQTDDPISLGHSHASLSDAHVRSLQRRLELRVEKPCLFEIRTDAQYHWQF
jgi:hypothetical protein